MWDVANNEPVSPPIPFSELVTRLGFVAGETMLLVESWKLPAGPKRWLIDLPVDEGSAKELLVRTQVASGQRSFLSGSEEVSAEQALTYAMSIGPLRSLTKQELKELWSQLTDGRSMLP
jgi:hypothetical protein